MEGDGYLELEEVAEDRISQEDIEAMFYSGAKENKIVRTWFVCEFERALHDNLSNANSTDLSLRTSSGCCMYKVPPKLRKINEEAYTPSFISIGPFHHGDKRLETMQNLKFQFFNRFLNVNSHKDLRDYAEAIYGWTDEISSCYSERLSCYDFSMILVDACFIIGFFMANTMDEQFEDLLLRSEPGMNSNLMLDLILVENQIPFFLLERLFQRYICPPIGSNVSFLELAFDNFVSFFSKDMHPSNHNQLLSKFFFGIFVEKHLRLPSGEIRRVLHLCDLLRIFYIRGTTEKRVPDTEMKRSYGVSQLKDAGLEFRANNIDRGLIEVRCSEEGRLEIPSFYITDRTEVMLRNVIAFEQCHYPFHHYVTDYVILLDCLINTEKDVEILVEKRIIQNWIANDKVASMVNKLCSNVTTRNMNPCYTSVYQRLTEIYDSPYYKNKATFMSEYWSTPWKRISLLGGILLLSLTLIQTICSVIPLFKKNN